MEEFRTCRDCTASGRIHRIDHGRGTIRVASVMDDDTGADLPTAPGDPGADATGRPGHQRSPRFRSSATGGAAPVTAGAGSGRWR